MTEMPDIFKDEFVPNIQTANKTSYGQWKQSNPKEAAAYEAYRDAVNAHTADPKSKSPVAPSLTTRYGKALVAAGKLQVSVTDIGADYTIPPDPTPDPPPSGTVMLSDDWTDISTPPWTAMFDYTGTPTITGGSVQQSPSGRIKVVTSPDGIGRALRTEIRDSDPPWPNNTANDRAHLAASSSASFGPNGVLVGDIFYFDFELWLPNNNPIGDYFDYPLSQWYRIWEPHEGTGTRWSGFTLVSDGLPANNAWLPLRVAGGTYPQNPSYYPLIQLTNSDGSWHMQNFNRRIHIRYGGRFAPDNTGWFEAFVDGGQVIPKTFHANMWVGDSGQYLTPGQYKAHGDLFTRYGKSVVYILKCTIEKM